MPSSSRLYMAPDGQEDTHAGLMQCSQIRGRYIIKTSSNSVLIDSSIFCTFGSSSPVIWPPARSSSQFGPHSIFIKSPSRTISGALPAGVFSAGCLLMFHNHSSKVHSSHQSSAGSGYRKGLRADSFSGLISVQAFLFQRPAAFIFVLVLPLLRVADARLCFYIIEVHIFRTGTVCPRVFAGDGARVATDAFIQVHDHPDLRFNLQANQPPSACG